MSDSYVGLKNTQVPAASVATRIIQSVYFLLIIYFELLRLHCKALSLEPD
jgi:hypothetical protein